MTSRLDAIRAAFSVPAGETLSADNKPASPTRVAAGSVRAVRETFSDIERENDELRAQLASSAQSLELDPTLVDPSPFADRFGGQDDAALQALKASIETRGQELPILVRPYPQNPGRFQCAYGHRRLRATRELGIKVRAQVREMSDQELVVAQGVENSAREDLSFIERAVFAVRMEDAGFERSVVQTALTIDRAEASKLVSTARSIPADLIAAIGRAPKIGRGRWLALAETLKEAAAIKRARAAVRQADAPRESDQRFLSVLAAALARPEREASPAQTIRSRSGEDIAQVVSNQKQLRLSVSRTEYAAFVDFLIDQLPDLFEAYAEKSKGDHSEP